MKIDGKRSLVLYDKDRTIIENSTLADLSDFSIESVRSRAARSALLEDQNSVSRVAKFWTTRFTDGPCSVGKLR
jgi:hypothetical protein